MSKYFTIVLRADTPQAEHDARQLIPEAKIGEAVITSCSLGDIISLSDKFKELIPDDKEEEISALEMEGIAPFLPAKR